MFFMSLLTKHVHKISIWKRRSISEITSEFLARIWKFQGRPGSTNWIFQSPRFEPEIHGQAHEIQGGF